MLENVIVIAAISLAIILFSLFLIIYRKKIIKEKEELLKKILNDDQFEFYLFDLRSFEQYTKSHIPGAISYPIEEIEVFLPTEKMFLPLFVYGTSLRQAAFGASRLLEMGYFNVQSLGTIKVWKGEMETDKSFKAIDLLCTLLKETK